MGGNGSGGCELSLNPIRLQWHPIGHGQQVSFIRDGQRTTEILTAAQQGLYP
jgi:hypothetical protein